MPSIGFLKLEKVDRSCIVIIPISMQENHRFLFVYISFGSLCFNTGIMKKLRRFQYWTKRVSSKKNGY